MSVPLLPLLLFGGTGGYVYLKGVPKALRDWAGTEGRAKSEAREATATTPQAAPAIPQVVVVENPRNKRSWFLWASMAVGSLAVYYYVMHRSGTKKVIHKVEETAGETQELVKECDENNEQRFEELDRRNDERTDNLSAEIRGESRAHFEILSKQLFCVTQVCLQTMNAVANGITGTGDDEFEQRDEKLIAYGQKAQQMSDRLFENDTYLRARELHVDECRAQLGHKKLSNKSADFVTPGGGADWGVTPGADSYTQTGNVTSLSAPDAVYEEREEEEEEVFSLMQLEVVQNLGLSFTQQQIVQRVFDPVAQFAVVNRYPLVFGTFGTVVCYKAINFVAEKLGASKTTHPIQLSA